MSLAQCRPTLVVRGTAQAGPGPHFKTAITFHLVFTTHLAVARREEGALEARRQREGSASPHSPHSLPRSLATPLTPPVTAWRTRH